MKLSSFRLLVLVNRSVETLPRHTNAHATIEVLLDTSLSIPCMSYQRKIPGQFFSELSGIHSVQYCVSNILVLQPPLILKYKVCVTAERLAVL
jgi:hypothetical protein